MRRDEIKRAAIQVFSDRGYHAAKVSEIVGAAGVAQGTFYLYFQSKQALFGEILDDYLDLVTGAVSRWNVAGISTLAQLRSDLRGIGMRLTEVMRENEELTRIFFQEALAVDPAFNQQIAAFYDRLTALIRAVNEVCYSNGIYRKHDPVVLAHAVIGMIERVVFQYIVSSDPGEVDAQTVVNECIDLVLFGAALERALP